MGEQEKREIAEYIKAAEDKKKQWRNMFFAILTGVACALILKGVDIYGERIDPDDVRMQQSIQNVERDIQDVKESQDDMKKELYEMGKTVRRVELDVKELQTMSRK